MKASKEKQGKSKEAMKEKHRKKFTRQVGKGRPLRVILNGEHTKAAKDLK